MGDFAYDLFEDEGRNGDDFMNEIQEIAAYVPYMTCPGNHERYYNFSHYKNRFSMPGNKKGFFTAGISVQHISLVTLQKSTSGCSLELNRLFSSMIG